MKKPRVVTIPKEDMQLCLVGRRPDDARPHLVVQGGGWDKRGALPPAGVGTPPEAAGTFLARDTQGTPAMAAAVRALLGVVREVQDGGLLGMAVETCDLKLPGTIKPLEDVGLLGAVPMGVHVEGCMAIVGMGVDWDIYLYSSESGFFDPPGNVVVDLVKVEEDLGWPWPSSSEPQLRWPPQPWFEGEQEG